MNSQLGFLLKQCATLAVRPSSMLVPSSTRFLLRPQILTNIQTAEFRNKNMLRHLGLRTRRGGGFDEALTAENRKFLDEMVLEKYRAAEASSPLKMSPWPRGEFMPNTLNKRVGVIAIKLGCMPQWTKDGKKIYTTLLQVLDNHVIDYIPPEIFMKTDKRNLSREGRRGMVLVGAISSDPRLYTAQYLNLFRNSGTPPKRKLSKFMVSPNAAIQPGTPLYASHFRVGDYIDVGANTIGFGFQGVMKKWGFKGGPRSHGSTKFHRKRGNIGSGRDRRPVKGTKMAGRMGNKYRELKGLKIWRVNTKYNILYVYGPVMPGPTHCYVRVTDSCLPKFRTTLTADNHPPFPTHYVDDKVVHEDLFLSDMHKFSDPTITFEKFEVKQQPKREGAKLAKIK